jgi:hypothetical protein
MSRSTPGWGGGGGGGGGGADGGGGGGGRSAMAQLLTKTDIIAGTDTGSAGPLSLRKDAGADICSGPSEPTGQLPCGNAVAGRGYFGVPVPAQPPNGLSEL